MKYRCLILKEKNSAFLKSGAWARPPPLGPLLRRIYMFCKKLYVKKLVKYMMTILSSVLGETNLAFEELSIFLTRAETCLNSCPITMLSSDPSDLIYLITGHFLIGDFLTAVFKPDITDITINRLTRQRSHATFITFITTMG